MNTFAGYVAYKVTWSVQLPCDKPLIVVSHTSKCFSIGTPWLSWWLTAIPERGKSDPLKTETLKKRKDKRDEYLDQFAG